MSSGKHRAIFATLFAFAALLLGAANAQAQTKPKLAPPVAKPAAHAAHAASAGAAKPGGMHGPTTAGRTTGHMAGPAGHPGPAPRGMMESHTAHGDITRRADGRPRDFHSNRGYDVHHGLDGHRRVEVERADHSRIVAEHGGRGYVQHPYMYRGREFGRRTYYHDGRVYDRYYGRHFYHGVYVSYYTPAYYYRPAFYGWAYNPWAAPVAFSWGWGASPWYAHYGFYFQPYPVYPSAAFWLTDYMISASLASAYSNLEAQQIAAANAAPDPNSAALSPQTKDLISAEVQRQIALTNAEAATAATAPPDPASSSVQRMLTDGVQHVFVVGHELDVVNSAGAECAVSQGDALQLVGPPPPDSPVASLSVLASKGGIECRRGDTVSVNIADLQEMQNHMRETIDAGMGELQKSAGAGGLPAMPAMAKGEPDKAAFTADAPPPDPNVKTELAQQYNDGVADDQVAAQAPQTTPAPETAAPTPQIVQGGVEAPAPAPSPAATTAQISLGQSIGDVTAALGQPQKVVDLNTKLIYVYKDLKVTFKDGKVTDVQ